MPVVRQFHYSLFTNLIDYICVCLCDDFFLEDLLGPLHSSHVFSTTCPVVQGSFFKDPFLMSCHFHTNEDIDMPFFGRLADIGYFVWNAINKDPKDSFWNIVILVKRSWLCSQRPNAENAPVVLVFHICDFDNRASCVFFKRVKGHRIINTLVTFDLF